MTGPPLSYRSHPRWSPSAGDQQVITALAHVPLLGPIRESHFCQAHRTIRNPSHHGNLRGRTSFAFVRCIRLSFLSRVFNWPSQFFWPLFPCACACISPQSAQCESIFSQFISATLPPPSQTMDLRNEPDLPQGWSSLGCYT